MGAEEYIRSCPLDVRPLQLPRSEKHLQCCARSRVFYQRSCVHKLFCCASSLVEAKRQLALQLFSGYAAAAQLARYLLNAIWAHYESLSTQERRPVAANESINRRWRLVCEPRQQWRDDTSRGAAECTAAECRGIQDELDPGQSRLRGHGTENSRWRN